MSREAYMNFIEKRQKIDRRLGLTALERELLEYLVLAYYRGQPMNVSDAMKLKNIGSPCTIHRWVQKFIKVDLISFLHKHQNFRIKYIVPTGRSRHYFNRIGETLLEQQAKAQGEGSWDSGQAFFQEEPTQKQETSSKTMKVIHLSSVETTGTETTEMSFKSKETD